MTPIRSSLAIALLASLVALARPAQAADQVSESTVYAGFSLMPLVVLSPPPSYSDVDRLEINNGRGGLAFGFDVSVEWKRWIFGGSTLIGGLGLKGAGSGFFGFLGGRAGYFLTDTSTAPYVAAGGGLHGVTYCATNVSDFCFSVDAGGAAALAEVGVLFGRERRVGQFSLAATFLAPFYRLRDTWSPQLGLALRLGI